MYKSCKLLNVKQQLMVAILAASTFMVFAAEEQEYLEANYIEAGISHHSLTDSFEDWQDAFIKVSWQQTENTILEAEIARQKHFGETGVLYTGGLTHTFNDDWYGSLYLGSSDGAFFLPKIRVDGLINRKVLPEKNMVLTLGLGYEEAQEVNDDQRLYLGASYYFQSPWLVEGGVRFNDSSPGSERSTRYRFATTYGKPFERYVTAEFETGNEAYQVVAEDTIIVDFDSYIISLTWREWVDKSWGFAVRGELYNSDEYDRNGVFFSAFKHF